MKWLFVLLTLPINSSGFAQTVNKLSWYKMLTGEVDSSAVTMHLHKSNHEYYGYYYYNSQQKPTYFAGEDTTIKGKIKVVLFSASEGTEELTFSLNGVNALGTWRKDEKSKPSPFTATEITTPISFTYIFTKGTRKLRPNWNNSPQASYEAASVWPNGNRASDRFLKDVIGHTISNRYSSNEEIGSFFLRAKKEYFASYFNDKQTLKDKDIKAASPIYSEETINRLMIAHQSSKILNLALSSYSYTGGAHGNHGTIYICLDLVNSKKLRLQDIINTEGQKALNSLLEKSFRISNNLKENDSLQKGGLFENTIKTTDNFYITPKGIMFNYNPYELGPYALGEIEIFVPIKDIETYIQPGYKTLLQ